MHKKHHTLLIVLKTITKQISSSPIKLQLTKLPAGQHDLEIVGFTAKGRAPSKSISFFGKLDACVLWHPYT